jgi:hypothetical protein
MKTIPKFINPAFAALVLACFGLLPIAEGTPDPGAVGGTFSTADGSGALAVNTGSGNSGFGFQALNHNTTGTFNSGFGFQALDANTTGVDNTGVGDAALTHNSIGNRNTAVGAFALDANTAGGENTATGFAALDSNTLGAQNVAVGAFALFSANASFNTAMGWRALDADTTGSQNTAVGFSALGDNLSGTWNTAIGLNALLHNMANSNVAVGVNAGRDLTTGVGNVCIGVNVFGVAGESNTTRIKNIFSSFANFRAVYVNSDNKLGTLVSSRRFKEDIKPMEKTSETILALKPVTFRYKKEVDSAQALSFGLIAEEVAQVDPDLITRDEEGKPETVRYEAVNAMLLNEFLKEHQKVQQLEKQIEKLTAGLQKVSDQLELSKPEPQTVANNQ